MKKILNFLMLSCKKASALVDKKTETKLSVKENIQLHLHTSMCDACTAYLKQSKIISSALNKCLHDHTDEINSVIENKALQEKIISGL